LASIRWLFDVMTPETPKKPTPADLLAEFEPAKHRHGSEDRAWDDAPRGRERNEPFACFTEWASEIDRTGYADVA
jgi:hypothetical protein